MISAIKCFILILCFVFLNGCASGTRYEWNSYDTNLYDHYKNPTEKESFVESLKETIAEGEAAGRVPPGIYAEYGFVLYEMGNSQMAIQFYQKEAARWPESRIFMTKMIAVAQKRIKKQSDTQKPADVQVNDTNQGQSKPVEVAK